MTRALRALWIALALLLGTAAVSPPLDALGNEVEAQSRRRRARRPSRPRRPRLTAAQRRAIRRRHRAPSRDEVRRWEAEGPPPLVLRVAGQSASFALTPLGDAGGFEADDLLVARQAFRHRDGTEHDIHPRLLELVYRAARHFRAPYVHLVSGVRAGSPTSRHTQGRAIDMVLPGVSDRRLAAWLRPQGFVGVGLYPTSSFVHLDVRARSYFWSDASGPDQPNRERPMLARQTHRYDAAARRRGDAEPVPDLEVHTEEMEAEAETPTPADEPELDAGVGG